MTLSGNRPRQLSSFLVQETGHFKKVEGAWNEVSYFLSLGYANLALARRLWNPRCNLGKACEHAHKSKERWTEHA